MLVKRDDRPSLAEQIEEFISDPNFNPENLDNAARHRLSEAARKLSLATETQGDTVHRMAHLPFQLPLALVGMQTGIFEMLSDLKGAPASTAMLAEKTDIHPSLMKRFLRYYQSFGMVSQVDDDLYIANSITRALISLGGRSALPFLFDSVVPAVNAMPRFIRENKQTNLSDRDQLPWHEANATPDSFFDWVNKRPDQLKTFMGWMVAQRDGLPIFLNALEFDVEFAKGADASTPVFVDVGGSMGHQCIALRQRYPNLVGRIILEDLSETIEKAKANPLPGFEGVETVVHDFFTPQPVQGARAYYMRNIMHDWPAEKCVEILKNIKVAMTSESRILVDEMIIPEQNVPWRAAQLDFIMGTCFASQERSYADWLALFDEAGLQIDRMWKYTEEFSDYVISLKLK